jgi:TPR repeat protein
MRAELSRVLRATLMALVAQVSITAASLAGPLEEATAAYEKRDYETALRRLRPLADQSNAAAQYTLGTMYTNGQGTPSDNVAAAKLYRLAAEQGHAKAQDTLGVMYVGGWGVPKDDVLAYMWFNLSAAQGDTEASETRDIISRYMTADQIANAQRLAREWTLKH